MATASVLVVALAEERVVASAHAHARMPACRYGAGAQIVYKPGPYATVLQQVRLLTRRLLACLLPYGPRVSYVSRVAG